MAKQSLQDQESHQHSASHQHGGLHYSQTDCADAQIDSDNLGKQFTGDKDKATGRDPDSDNTKQNLRGNEQADTSEHEDDAASFTRTKESLEALFVNKVEKFSALSNLLSAEMKLTWNAILVGAGLLLGLLVIALTLWITINFGLGLVVFQMSQSLIWTLLSILLINVVVFVLVAYLLKKSWLLAGFSQTLSAVKGA